MKSLKFRLKLTSKIFFISIFTLLSINSVFAISVNTSSSFQSNCPWANVNETIYITWTTLKIYPTDLMRNNTLSFVRNEESVVSIWENTTSTLSSWCFQELNWSTWWGRLSNVVPWDNQMVWIFKNFWNLCDVSKVKRTDTSRPSVQFVYRIAYKEEVSLATWTSSYFYYPYTSWVLSSTQSFIADQTKRNWGDVIYHADECHNFTFAWCWDWLLDATHWEACDDGNNIDWDGCSATCQMISPSIDIDKRDANPADLDLVVWNDTQTVYVWTWAIFRIRVTNNYTESLKNLVLTDAIAPNCAWSVTLPSTFPSTWTWVTVSWSWDHTNAVLEVWEYIDYVCSRDNTTAWYTNSATVNWLWFISNIPVTDTDTTVVLIPAWPTCWTAWWYNFSYSETVWPAALTFCSSWATPVPNPPVFPSQWWSTSWTCNGSWSTVSCNASRSSWGWGWGGWGWSGPSCIKISIPALEAAWKWKAISSTWSVNLVCYWNAYVWNIWIDCDLDWNWATKSISEQKSSTMSWSMQIAEFTCTYNNLNTASHPKCYVTSWSSTVTTSSVSALACSTWISVWRNYCWDWIVQRPNSDWFMEECEAVNWVFPSWCVNCKTTNFTIPWEWGWILTYPGWWNIIIRPFGQVIIWAWSNPFTVFWTYPFIWNDSSEDIYLDYPLCVHNSDSSVLLRSNDTWLTRVCTAQNIGWMYPGVTKTFESLNYWDSVNIKWIKIINNINYKDTILKITLWDFKDAFFAAVFKVRVSKPAVATVWGWTSLIKNNNVTADINKVASDWFSNPDKNKNFVWAWVSTWSTSSYSKNVDNSISINKISSGQTQKVEVNLTKVTTTTVSWDKYIWDTLTKYNGLSNVYIVKNWDLTINANITWSWARTYIIEWWNLNINQNINYGDNIAFVVKWGDIIISSNVTSINGTFISIKVAWVWWKILSVESDNKLVVNWSLYGDIESLVNNRTYIQNKNDLINVWTVVSFGSSLFRKQAPLVWDFIWEYVESKKVAK